ncbi:uncharacterized protein LOC129581251 [Paramacrobiotus metropolitanus]|uniref:uncharacterized protein LOC129581251 n=1 Tax=Paramacrobiotus metropolitanus TaxID=2943436 RepID=UPI00244625D2|nr:uncharacterized protein LOC129581251 [Paramacrobiotus metropolitanus]
MAVVLKVLLFGFLCCVVGPSNALGPYSSDEEQNNNGKPDSWQEITWWLSPDFDTASDMRAGHPRPPHPRPPFPPRVPFFVGVYESNPEKEAQRNMFKEYQCLGLSTDLVGATIRVNISVENRTNFHYTETANNNTIWDFTFQLGVANSTTFLGGNVDVLVLAKNRENNLDILYNSTATGRVRISFDFEGRLGRSRGFDATYRCDRNATSDATSAVQQPLDRPGSNTVKGNRHFSAVRRPPPPPPNAGQAEDF